jgi:Tfp pilus assembly protein PilN
MRAVNLIPAEHRSGGAVGSRSEGGVFLVLGLLGGLVVLALLYGLARHKVSSQRAEATSLATQVQRVQAQAAQLTPYTSFMAMREQRLQAVSQLVGDRFDWAVALHELGRVLPYDTSLSSVQGTVGSSVGTAGGSSSSSKSSATVASATPAGATPTLTLTGCSVSQSMVAETLVRLHLVAGVSNVTLQSSTKSDSSSNSSSGSTGCPGGDPAFTVLLTFQPLPTAPALSAEAAAPKTQTVASTATRASGAAASSASSGRLR